MEKKININIQCINDIEITQSDIDNKEYDYQELLTTKLDQIDSDFNQEIINEIVLWKVNRYVSFDKEGLSLLNQINKKDNILNVELTKKVLLKLLSIRGIRLAMASTILRFKNPNIYQIIDQRVYRFIYPNQDLTKIQYKKIETQIEIYLKYLDDLNEMCNDKNIPFGDSDRIIYSLDKKLNKDVKIK